MSDLRGALFKAMTGRDGDVSGQSTGDVRGQLLAVGGASSRTKSGIDLTAASRRLGVSRRTLERWVNTAATGQGQHPSRANQAKLARSSRQAASTKRGRAAALAGSALGRDRGQRGMRVNIDAMQGPVGERRSDYKRSRVTTRELSPEEAEAMIQAWEEGGEKGFMSWATGHWQDTYLDDWTFGDVDNVSLESPRGGKWRPL